MSPMDRARNKARDPASGVKDAFRRRKESGSPERGAGGSNQQKQHGEGAHDDVFTNGQ